MTPQIRELSYNLSGAVTNMGLGVAGTRIRLYQYWHKGRGLVRRLSGEQVTGPKGGFNFDVRRGIYCVEVVPSDLTRFARQSFETIKVTANTNLNVILNTGAIFSGMVRDAEGKPLAACELLLFGIEPHVIRVAEPVAPDGSFSVTLPPGRYYGHVRCQAKETSSGDQRRSGPGPVFLCPTLEVIDLERDLSRDFSIPPLTRLEGLVTDQSGHPLGGVRATILAAERPSNTFARDIPMEISTVTAKDGKFECLVKAGSYHVRFEPPADSSMAEKQISALLVDQDRSRTFALETGHQLFGRVASGGEPVSRAMITIFGVNNHCTRITDDDGWYSFSLPGGSYQLAVVLQPDAQRKNSLELAPWTGELILDKDTELDLELDAGVLVSGRVLDPLRKPRDGVLLSIYPTRDGEHDPSGAGSQALSVGITGADGSYEFRLAEGEYWLVLNNQPSTGHLVEVKRDRASADLTVEDVCLVTFEVVSQDEEPIPNCLVSFESYSARISDGTGKETASDLVEPAASGDDGRCTLTLPSGIYSFHFHAPLESKFGSRHIRQLSVMSDMVRRVKLAARGE